MPRFPLAVAVLLSFACDENAKVAERSCTPAATDTLSTNIEISGQTAPCELVFEDSVVLYTDTVDFGDVLSPIRELPDGRFVTHGSSRERLAVWAPDGHLEGSIGRRGLGPGEFQSITGMHIDNTDTLHVSNSPGRWEVYGPSLTYVRSNPFNLSGWRDLAFLDDGRMVTGRESGLPEDSLLFIVDRTGRVEQSFGRAAHHMDMRHIAYNGGNHFWTLSPTAYVLERWNVSGTREVTITRTLDDFPPSDLAGKWSTYADGPNILWFDIDDAARLWVVVVYPNEAAALDAPVAERADWLLEIIDSGTGSLLVSKRFKTPVGLPSGLVNGRKVYRTHGREDGTYEGRVYSFRLNSLGNGAR